MLCIVNLLFFRSKERDPGRYKTKEKQIYNAAALLLFEYKCKGQRQYRLYGKEKASPMHIFIDSTEENVV